MPQDLLQLMDLALALDSFYMFNLSVITHIFGVTSAAILATAGLYVPRQGYED